jgi:hypothetical protein
LNHRGTQRSTEGSAFFQKNAVDGKTAQKNKFKR